MRWKQEKGRDVSLPCHPSAVAAAPTRVAVVVLVVALAAALGHFPPWCWWQARVQLDLLLLAQIHLIPSVTAQQQVQHKEERRARRQHCQQAKPSMRAVGAGVRVWK